MNTAVWALVVAVAALAVIVVILLVLLRRTRTELLRTAQGLAAVRAEVDALGGAVDLLGESVRQGPEESSAAPASPEQVAVITGIADDDGDLSTGRVASVTLAAPLMKAAALSYGIRHALHEEQRMRYSYVMRKELRRQRKMRRRRRSQRSASEGWVT